MWKKTFYAVCLFLGMTLTIMYFSGALNRMQWGSKEAITAIIYFTSFSLGIIATTGFFKIMDIEKEIDTTYQRNIKLFPWKEYLLVFLPLFGILTFGLMFLLDYLLGLGLDKKVYLVCTEVSCVTSFCTLRFWL